MPNEKLKEKLEAAKNESKAKRERKPRDKGSNGGNKSGSPKHRVNSDGTVDVIGGEEGSQGSGQDGTEANGPVVEPNENGSGTGETQGDRKQSILERIRNKRAQGLGGADSKQPEGDQGQHTGSDGRSEGTDLGVSSDSRSDARDNRTDDGRDGSVGGSDRSPDDDSPSSETRRGVKGGGLLVEIPKVPTGKGNKPVEAKLEDVLTDKEAKSIQPRIIDALKLFFGNADKMIGFVTKDATKKNVVIWSNMEPGELEILATVIIESGQRSKIVATMTRRISRDYIRLQAGIILLPRFLKSISHVMDAGIALPFGRNA